MEAQAGGGPRVSKATVGRKPLSTHPSVEERRAAGISSVMSASQWKLLEYFADTVAAPVEDAREDTGLSKTNAYHHADMLVERGLLENVGTHGRAKPLMITELGRLVLTMRKRSRGERLSKEEQDRYNENNLLHQFITQISGVTDPEMIGKLMKSAAIKDWIDQVKSIRTDGPSDAMDVKDTQPMRKGGKSAAQRRNPQSKPEATGSASAGTQPV